MGPMRRTEFQFAEGGRGCPLSGSAGGDPGALHRASSETVQPPSHRYGLFRRGTGSGAGSAGPGLDAVAEALRGSGNGGHGPGTTSRLERKYLLSPEEARQVSRFLAARLEVDPHARGRPGNAYTVRSVYFDSPGLICYHAKQNGAPVREKYRVRTYNEPGSAPIFLERKARQGHLYRKEKARMNDARLGCQPARDGQGVPRLEEMYDEGDLRPLLTRWAILEVKFSGVVPWTLRELTRRFPLLWRACSKYAASIEHVVLNSATTKGVGAHAQLL